MKGPSEGLFRHELGRAKVVVEFGDGRPEWEM